MSYYTRAQGWLLARAWHADVAALLFLTVLWALYFWRALTPDPANQISLADGDFSGQFFAFGGYHAARILSGQIPLWNPFNYAGHPFLADVQSAVFYPPRLLTILLSNLFAPHRWTYGALQLEALAHFWLAALFMYLFVRTLTGFRMAGLISAITLTFGGYLTSYPPLQLAILEAGIWLPLALLGLFRGSAGGRLRPAWLVLSSLALGLALLAGHPQTGLHFSYILIAFFIYRAVTQQIRLPSTIVAIILVLTGGFGLAALQILPAVEYTRLTTRAEIGIDALSNGFDFSELPQIILPNVLTTWSPLYFGIAPLVLLILAAWRAEKTARFWLVIALVALGLSLGGKSVLFPIVYLIVPGFQFFRGQERAAFAIAHSVAILAGLGSAALMHWSIDDHQHEQRFRRWLKWASGAAWATVLLTLIASRALTEGQVHELYSQSVLMAVLVTSTWALFSLRWRNLSATGWQLALIGLLVFDLFSNTMNRSFNPIQPSQQRAATLEENPLLSTTQRLTAQSPERIDGQHILGWNYGSLLGIQDIWGVSPLRLVAADTYLEGMPLFRRHELLAVELVLTDWQQLEVDSTVLETLDTGRGTYLLHQIDDPRPRALLMYEVAVLDDDTAIGIMNDPHFDPRHTIILDTEPPIDIAASPPADPGLAQITLFEPEHIIIETEADANAILSVSEMFYPGWQATVDGERVEMLKAYTGLRAIALEAGQHTIEMLYQPMSFRIGVATSLISALGILGVAIWGLIIGRRKT